MNDSPPPQPGTISGKWVILAMLGLGLAASAGAIWYYAQVQHRVLKLWGPQYGALIVNAPSAELVWLEPATSPAPDGGQALLALEGVSYRAVASRDVSRSPGIVRLRGSLIYDATYTWNPVAENEPARWAFALRFVDRDQHATLAFAPNLNRVLLIETGTTAPLAFREKSGEPVVRDFERFVAEQKPE